MTERSLFRKFLDDARGFRWRGVDLLEYKEESAAPFKAVTRQTLFADPDLKGELRYFEIAPGGHTTLERHEHMHAVMVLRGSGRCLVGNEVQEVREHDLVTVPPLTWHQLRADGNEPLGFLCMVNAERDRPQLPDERDIEALAADPAVAAFLAETKRD